MIGNLCCWASSGAVDTAVTRTMPRIVPRDMPPPGSGRRQKLPSGRTRSIRRVPFHAEVAMLKRLGAVLLAVGFLLPCCPDIRVLLSVWHNAAEVLFQGVPLLIGVGSVLHPFAPPLARFHQRHGPALHGVLRMVYFVLVGAYVATAAASRADWPAVAPVLVALVITGALLYWGQGRGTKADRLPLLLLICGGCRRSRTSSRRCARAPWRTAAGCSRRATWWRSRARCRACARPPKSPTAAESHRRFGEVACGELPGCDFAQRRRFDAAAAALLGVRAAGVERAAGRRGRR